MRDYHWFVVGKVALYALIAFAVWWTEDPWCMLAVIATPAWKYASDDKPNEVTK